MKIIIAGSREIDDYNLVEYAAAASGWIDGETEIVSGMAKGVDELAVEFAKQHDLPLHQFPANWYLHGKSAGPIRNDAMAHFADALIAVWDGKSRGTKNMIDTAQSRGLKVAVYRTDIGTFLAVE